MRLTSLITLLSLLGLTCSAHAEDVFIKTRDGATLSAIVVLPEGKPAQRIPAVMEFTIYARPEQGDRALAAELAARGYAGVIAYARGKFTSPDQPAPYEHESTDTHAVLDWIARQPWSDGRIGMIGGSYSGYTAWAATKRKHAALKAIAVSAAQLPGQGLPMQNNAFTSANYVWPFYVTNNKLLDEALNADNQRWFKLTNDWFASGRPYREIDAVDGTPNPWLQRWLKHPSYDKYWQSMVPYGSDFAHIDIPVLSITGYYDDAQVSVLEYFKQHEARGRGQLHHLVIGPYDHWGANAREKAMNLRDYALDPVAQLDSMELKLAFMDHVLRGKPKPELLRDRVNFQLMGANQWRHVPSLGAMHGIPMRLYLSEQMEGEFRSLANRQPPANSKVTHTVDLADRRRFHHYHGYPIQIVQGPLQYITEAVFATAPFQAPIGVMGEFEGEMVVAINKRDFDLGITVYEAMPDGKLFHLASTLQRASHADDRTKRKLLTPGKKTRVRFTTSLVARQLQPGSRLLLLVDAVKNPYWQVNYGTGKDVSDESVKDAGDPLTIEILSGSYIGVPLDNTIVKPQPPG